MKKQLALFAVCAGLLAGCGKTYQVGTLEWVDLTKTNTLAVFTTHGPITTNVTSVEQAANILGQYGWEVVARDGRVMTLKRSGSGNSFTLNVCMDEFNLRYPGGK